VHTTAEDVNRATAPQGELASIDALGRAAVVLVTEGRGVFKRHIWHIVLELTKPLNALTVP
jgi:hypothetical protein